jgi:hypothetical protein
VSLVVSRQNTDLARLRRWIVDRLASRLDALAKDMADAYLQLAVEGNGRASIDGFRISEAATQHLLFLLRALATDQVSTDPPTEELSAVTALVVELAGAQHSIEQILDAHGTCFLVAWRAVDEELADLPSDTANLAGPAVGRALMGAMARSSVVVHEAFGSASKRTTELAPPDILGQALDGGESLVRATRRAEVALWPVAQSHTVVVASCERVDAATPGTPTGIRRLMVAVEGLRHGGRAPLTSMRDGLVVVAAAGLPDAALAARSWRSLVDAVVLPPGYRLLVGVGLTEDGLAGVGRSYRQARRALELASTRSGSRIVVSYAEVLPQLLLLQDRLLTEDLYRLTIGSLERAESNGAGEVVASLRSYLDQGLNVMAAAKALAVHRHTLTTRLDKVEQLTGLRVDDGDHRLLLELGLRAGPVLDHSEGRSRIDRRGAEAEGQ